MRPDLSALDAQLEELSPPPGFDVLALAETYAGKLGPLSSVDQSLNALEEGVASVRAPVLRTPRDDASVPQRIELPEPLRDALLVEEPTGTRTLDEASTRGLEFEAESEPSVRAHHDVEPLTGSNDFELRESGAFEVSESSPPRRDALHDITMEPVDEELLEAGIDDMRPEASPLVNGSLFDLSAQASAEAEQEADAAFAELFAEATRQSSMPSVSQTDPADDTEVFHTSELALDPDALQENVPYSAADHADDDIEIEPNFHDETLDSAEFEIVNDVVTDARPSASPSGRPSRPPEKRPSFLGRLFSRKEE